MSDFYKISNDGTISRTDGVPIEPKTIKDMCYLISEMEILSLSGVGNPTPEQIYNYSKSGEVYVIFEWYCAALELAVKKGLLE